MAPTTTTKASTTARPVQSHHGSVVRLGEAFFFRDRRVADEAVRRGSKTSIPRLTSLTDASGSGSESRSSSGIPLTVSRPWSEMVSARDEPGLAFRSGPESP